jgi:hypothetical protein
MLDKEDKAPLLRDPGSRFYQKLELYALSIYAVYNCYKCKKPYIGGRVSCEREADLNRPDGGEGWHPEDYVCQDCAGFNKTCRFHGDQKLLYKCRYCCEQLPVWFCFGTTHFCDACHRKCDKKSHKCLGEARCIFGGDHEANGKEAAIGCEKCLIARKN